MSMLMAMFVILAGIWVVNMLFAANMSQPDAKVLRVTNVVVLMLMFVVVITTAALGKYSITMRHENPQVVEVDK